jgi:hypothetical protein
MKNKLRAELDAAKKDNAVREKEMYTQFDGAYTQYQTALETYDGEMEKSNTEKIQQFNILQEQKQTLANLQEQWQERLKENQKREALEAIMRKKKEEQEKEMGILNKAAEWV